MATKKKNAPTRATKKKGKKTTKRTAQKKASKKTTKRAPSKKRARKEKHVMVCADGPLCFWTTDGRVLSNLAELKDALNDMAEEVYKYHVSKDRNDFADWIENVLGDGTLAASIRKSRKPKSARTLVIRRLKVYEM